MKRKGGLEEEVEDCFVKEPGKKPCPSEDVTTCLKITHKTVGLHPCRE